MIGRMRTFFQAFKLVNLTKRKSFRHNKHTDCPVCCHRRNCSSLIWNDMHALIHELILITSCRLIDENKECYDTRELFDCYQLSHRLVGTAEIFKILIKYYILYPNFDIMAKYDRMQGDKLVNEFVVCGLSVRVYEWALPLSFITERYCVYIWRIKNSHGCKSRVTGDRNRLFDLLSGPQNWMNSRNLKKNYDVFIFPNKISR